MKRLASAGLFFMALNKQENILCWKNLNLYRKCALKIYRCQIRYLSNSLGTSER